MEGTLQSDYRNGSGAGNSKSKFTADLLGGIRVARRVGIKYQLFAEPNLRDSRMKYDMAHTINKKYTQRTGISPGDDV